MSLCKTRHIFSVVAVVFAIMLTSCDDTTDTLGTSLTNVANLVDVEAKDYSVASRSTVAENVVSRTKNGYLGRIRDVETNDDITCNYMTQFHVMGDVQFPPVDTLYIDPDIYDASVARYKQVEADSCAMVLYISGSIGDSLALMKVTANEMSVPYEESKSYTTDFDPESEGMIRTEAGSVHSQMAYTTSNRLFTEAQRKASTFSNRISISLNEPYTDRNGNTYNNYGTYLLRSFYAPEHSDNYNNSYRFAHDICPGFYIKNTGGIGNIASISDAQILVYYKGVLGDSIIDMYSSFGGTEEVIQKTTIKKSANVYEQLLTDNSCTYVKSPAGIFTELTLPVEAITDGHENDTINTARLFIPRMNNNVASDYSLAIPKNLLLIESDSVQSFFDNRKIADFRTSYIASYSSTSNGYTFGNISLLVSKLNQIKKDAVKKGITLPDTWNRVMLVPVETTYTSTSSSSSTSILTKVTHDMSFTQARLKKGTEDNDNIIISVIYSKFKE